MLKRVILRCIGESFLTCREPLVFRIADFILDEKFSIAEV